MRSLLLLGAVTVGMTLASPAVACSEQEQLSYLTGALYREAAPSTEGQAGVAAVIFNRVDSPGYPKTICAVVKQSGQFHYQVPRKPDPVKWALAKKNAPIFLQEYDAGHHRLEADVFVTLAGYHAFRSYPRGSDYEFDGNYFRLK